MRVLELGQFISVGFAGKLLAEQDHEVTKWISATEDDPTQGLEHGEELWAWLNAGKTVIKRRAELIAEEPPGSFDVVIDNFRVSAWERWGVDPAREARRLGVRWVSLRDEFDSWSFDAIAQARAWGDHVGYIPVYVGDTAAGLWMAFKATVRGWSGHYVLRQATCLAKLVEGELVVTPERNGKRVPWERDQYGPDGDGVTVMYRGKPVHEPFRDDQWRREHLARDADGRYIV